MNHIMIKLACIFFSIYKIKCTLSFFKVISKFSFIFFPVFLKEIKISIIKSVIKWNRFLIVYCALSKECIIFPFPFVSELLVWIIKFTISIHSSKLPITIINTTISITKLTLTMTKSILFHSSINTSVFILLCHNLFRCRIRSKIYNI